MFSDYFPVLVIVGMAGFMGAAAIFMSWILSPKNAYAKKLTPWECGLEPIGEADAGHFRIHFFLIAILFILFDIETLFLFPWAVIIADKSIAVLAFVEMVIFIAILSIGLIYAWKRGALDWFK